MNHSLHMLLFLALLLATAQVLAGLSVRLGWPAVLGQLLAGVLLGPTVLDLARLSYFSPLAAFTQMLGQLGAVALMFLAGLETNAAELRHAARPAFAAACGGVVLPFAGGYLLARAFGLGWAEALFVAAVLTATSVSISVQALNNLDQLRTRAGATILGAAIIDDVLGLMVLSLVIAVAIPVGGASWTAAAASMARVTFFLVAAFLFGPRLVRWIFRTPRTAALAVAFAFALSFAAEWSGGLAAVTGAFLAGLFVPCSAQHSAMREDVRGLVQSFFAPLFFVSIGLQIDAWSAGGALGFFVLLLLVAILGKVAGCGLGAWWSGLDGRTSLVVGVGMIPRGEVGLIAASAGWAAGLVSAGVYSLVVVLVLITTLATPALLRLFFSPGGLPDLPNANEEASV